MADLLVKNSLNVTKAVKLNTSLVHFYVNGYEGDPRFVLEVATTETTASGNNIRPVYQDTINEEKNLDEVFQNKVSEIASQIDWLPLIDDYAAPYVSQAIPLADTTVPIASNVFIELIDNIPSAGIDLSEAEIIINNGVQDFNITDECVMEGDPFNFTIKWVPTRREYKHY